ncbi:hypothetical protein DFH06DRAFT_1222020 [Mycena polygramma]|nr:hypothetical protein DFH06DRAFT_1222020 [Mycena polygramma]
MPFSTPARSMTFPSSSTRSRAREGGRGVPAAGQRYRHQHGSEHARVAHRQKSTRGLRTTPRPRAHSCARTARMGSSSGSARGQRPLFGTLGQCTGCASEEEGDGEGKKLEKETAIDTIANENGGTSSASPRISAAAAAGRGLDVRAHRDVDVHALPHSPFTSCRPRP